MKYTVYEIENLINGKKYIGCHKTNNLNDGYMGSGKLITKAICKYGLENFRKKIIHIYENEKDMLEKEKELVNDNIINSKDYYNLALGGGCGWSYINDNIEKYKHHRINKVIFVDENGNKYKLDKNDERIKKENLKPWNKGYTLYENSETNDIYYLHITDERVKLEIFQPINKNKALIIDENDKCKIVDKNHPKIKNGEYKLFWNGRKHSEETKQKMSEKASKRIGKLNSQYGTCWVTKNKKNKKIKKSELQNWIDDGWERGRKIK